MAGHTYRAPHSHPPFLRLVADVAVQPVTLLVDCQQLYPAGIVPQPLLDLMSWYNATTRDPVIVGAMSGSRDWAWLKVFLHMELFVQTPCFVIGALGLWRSELCPHCH